MARRVVRSPRPAGSEWWCTCGPTGWSGSAPGLRVQRMHPPAVRFAVVIRWALRGEVRHVGRPVRERDDVIELSATGPTNPKLPSACAVSAACQTRRPARVSAAACSARDGSASSTARPVHCRSVHPQPVVSNAEALPASNSSTTADPTPSAAVSRSSSRACSRRITPVASASATAGMSLKHPANPSWPRPPAGSSHSRRAPRRPPTGRYPGGAHPRPPPIRTPGRCAGAGPTRPLGRGRPGRQPGRGQRVVQRGVGVQRPDLDTGQRRRQPGPGQPFKHASIVHLFEDNEPTNSGLFLPRIQPTIQRVFLRSIRPRANASTRPHRPGMSSTVSVPMSVGIAGSTTR
jgi:hypothetical protein